jgi:predicted DNA-binding transcriptional regulator AlpA
MRNLAKLPVSVEDRAAFSIAEFCLAHGISRTIFYELKKRGEGPRMMKIVGRDYISREAAIEWRRAREAQVS